MVPVSGIPSVGVLLSLKITAPDAFWYLTMVPGGYVPKSVVKLKMSSVLPSFVII